MRIVAEEDEFSNIIGDLDIDPNVNTTSAVDLACEESIETESDAECPLTPRITEHPCVRAISPLHLPLVAMQAHTPPSMLSAELDACDPTTTTTTTTTRTTIAAGHASNARSILDPTTPFHTRSVRTVSSQRINTVFKTTLFGMGDAQPMRSPFVFSHPVVPPAATENESAVDDEHTPPRDKRRRGTPRRKRGAANEQFNEPNGTPLRTARVSLCDRLAPLCVDQAAPFVSTESGFGLAELF
jgi:hypothetical protein